MAFADDLLEQAVHLARREKRKPKQASLRRAVSTAYYALFHHFIESATANWKREDQRLVLARAFNHGQMRTACDTLVAALRKKRKAGSAAAGRPSAVESALEQVASVFLELQDDRNSADYDGTIKWTRTEVLMTIATASRAFKTWRAIRDEPEAQEFLLALLVKRR